MSGLLAPLMTVSVVLVSLNCLKVAPVVTDTPVHAASAPPQPNA